MENLDNKYNAAKASGNWSKLTIDSVEYFVKFDVQAEKDDQKSITCSLGGFQTMWSETINVDEIIQRLKRCNPLLACYEMMTRILDTITSIPKDEENIQLTVLNDHDFLHLNTKYYLSDGSDQIPLKFYWSLEKGESKLFFEMFNGMLMKIKDLENTNAFLNDEITKLTKETSTTEMFVDAFAQTDNDCDESENISATAELICHEGITCNKCEQDIFGNRYNCIECEDYDLCMACEKEMHHSEHIMVRYAHPDDKIRFSKLTQQILNDQLTPMRSSKRKRHTRF